MPAVTLKKDGHTVTTSVPAEAVKLRSLGYEDVGPKAQATKAEPKVAKTAPEELTKN